jgi:hypothetical protein
MRPGDMNQLDDDAKFNREFRTTIMLGAGMMLMLFMATLIGRTIWRTFSVPAHGRCRKRCTGLTTPDMS